MEGKKGEDVEINRHTEFIQFIGRKDKNGKEIFEGYIVNSYYEGLKGIIKFIRDGFVAQSIYNKEWFDINEKDEIIGNIYENPELLKDGK